MRLLLFIIAAITLYILRNSSFTIIWAIIAIAMLIFVNLIWLHQSNKNKHKYVSHLKFINDKGLKRLKGEWNKFDDVGVEFSDSNHPFLNDLDIFGQGSLFQMINETKTQMGRKALAKILTATECNKEIIVKNQQAIKELSKKRWWRQRLAVEGMMIEGKDISNEDLVNWGTAKNQIYRSFGIIILIRALPIMLMISLVAAFFLEQITFKIPIYLFLLNSSIIGLNIKNINNELNKVLKYKNQIKKYKRIIIHFEKELFQSEYIKELKKGLINDNGKTAVVQLKKLERLVDSILNRTNFVFFPINIILLWDYQCLIALEKWRSQSGGLIKEWLNSIGEIEGLSSLALIPYENPNWVYPSITDKPSNFTAIKMGHPLLGNKQVYNDISFGDAKVLLITGSNMSGKSTLLRSAGINLVLAYAGVPVCANYFELSIMNVYTCMRISDNLEKSISSFYAELLRIKSIVEAGKGHKPVFFLLDEIFKGTNSQDRHLGAKLLIKQLYENGAIGFVSTHDLELADMERETNEKLINYHFQEHYKNNEIFFDYRLRRGVSTTRNALYLMRLAGVETGYN